MPCSLATWNDRFGSSPVIPTSHPKPRSFRDLVRFGAGCLPPPWGTGSVLRTSAGAASHLHAAAMHLDHLGPESLDPTQDGLLVLRQRDPQAEDISAKRAPCQPRKPSPDHTVPRHQRAPGQGSAGFGLSASCGPGRVRNAQSVVPAKATQTLAGSAGVTPARCETAAALCCLRTGVAVNHIRLDSAFWKGQAALPLSETRG